MVATAAPRVVADASGEIGGQVLGRLLSVTWACVRCVGHGIVGGFEIAGGIVAAIVEGVAGGP